MPKDDGRRHRTIWTDAHLFVIVPLWSSECVHEFLCLVGPPTAAESGSSGRGLVNIEAPSPHPSLPNRLN